MNDNSKGRRGSGRREARIKIKFATPDALEKEYTSSLSKGRLFINTKKARPLRSHVKFNLILPVTNDIIELTGEVVHVTEPQPGASPALYGLGVQFTDLDAKKRARIERYISRINDQGEYIAPEEGEEEEAEETVIKEREYLKDALRRASKEMGELTPEELVSVKRKIKKFYAKKAKLNHYDLLGVGYGAAPSGIRSAYHKLSMEFYPDRQPKGLPKDLKDKIEDIFGRINRSYKVLRDIDSRLDYDISVGNWRSAKGVPELSEEAKRAHHKQVQYMKQFPEKVERAKALLGEAQALFSSGDEKSARNQLKFAYSFNPFNPKILYLMNQLGVKVKPVKEEG